MLFSMYASFRWARGKHYVRKTTALIITLSLLSTVGLYVVFFLPFLPFLPFLSFPFYEYWEERRLILPQPMKYSERVDGWGIFFITNPILQFVPQGSATPDAVVPEGGRVSVVGYRVVLLDMEIGAVHPMLVGFTLFLFFVMVNVLGALLGFLISKTRTAEKTGLGSMAFWGGIALGTIFLAFGIWLLTSVEIAEMSPPSRYYYDYGPPYLRMGAFACVVFGISWLTMIFLDRARVFSRTYNAFTQP